MDSFYFKPVINSIINLNKKNQQQQNHHHHHHHHHHNYLNFYAIELSNELNYYPEIWTDAPHNSSNATSSSNVSRTQWSAIPFKKITSLNNNHITIWHARIKFKTHHQDSIHYRFTYRLLPFSSKTPQSNSDKILWLGSPGQDGQIKFNSESNDSLKDILLDSCAKQSIDQQLIPDHHDPNAIINYHIFTLKTTSQNHIQTDANYQKKGNSITFQNPIHLPDHFLNTLEFNGLAFLRSKPTWFNPHPFIHLSEISSSFDTQLIIIQDPREDDRKNLLILIPISTNSSSSIIRSTTSSPLTICTTSTATDTDPPSTVKLMIINGPQSKLKHIIHHHSFILNNTSSVDHLDLKHDQEIPRNPKKLGYCTWDSLGANYRLSDVIRVLKSFQKSGIITSIDRVLLDDGWQDVNGQSLSGWGTKQGWMDLPGLENGESNLTKPSDDLKTSSTPNGAPTSLQGQGSDLTRAISLIRNLTNQSIKLLGVWVTITGYWSGLDSQSEIMKKFQLQKWSIRPSPQSNKSDDPSYWMLPKKSCIRSFWDTYFRYLISAGAQFIKIDNQAGLDRLISCESDPTENVEVYKTTLIDVVHDLAKQYFGKTGKDEEESTIIHSMAHSPQIWFRENHTTSESSSDQPKSKNKRIDLPILLPNLVKKVMRTSDDFFPDLIDSSGHQWHILSNAFNAILANGLGFIPDFDMTMTKHKFSDYHAAFRVFTNAQIYITDRQDEHDLSTCQKLTAPLKSKRGGNSRAGVIQSMDGAGCALSSNCLGQSAKDLSLPDSPWGLLKVGLPASYAGGGLIGIWNVKQSSQQVASTAADVITARDIAETILLNQSNDQNSIIWSTKDNSHRFENLVIFCDDNGSKKRNRRIQVIEEFDSNLEINPPQIASRPIIGTSLSHNNLNQNSFEIWRVCRLLDLPVESKKEISLIQVASLGLLNQFAGLCAVVTGSPPKRLPTRKTLKVKSHQATEVIKIQPAESDEPTQIQEAFTNGQLPPPETTIEAQHRDQDGAGGLDSTVNVIGFGLTNNQKQPEQKLKKFCHDFTRNPIQTFKIQVVDLIKFTILLTWKSFKSIIFCCMKSSCSKKSSSDDDGQENLGHVSTSSTDALRSINDISERTPLLLPNNHAQSREQSNYVASKSPSFTHSPPSLESPIEVDTSKNREKGLEFHTPFTAEVGFLIRMKFSNQIFNGGNSDDMNDHDKSLLIKKLEESIEVRIDDHIFPINDVDQKSIVKIEVLNNSHSSALSSNPFSHSQSISSSETSENKQKCKGDLVGEFLLTIDLELVQSNSNFLRSSLKNQDADTNDDDDDDQDFWSISIREKENRNKKKEL